MSVLKIPTVGALAKARKRCPCGSGKKYIKCCGQRSPAQRARPRRLGVILVMIAVVATAIVLLETRSFQQAGEPRKVWSAEHGHWHTIDPETGAAIEDNLVPRQTTESVQGKVWSPEHGHWHDAANAGGAGAH
jgi:hypothetical protein